MSKWKPPDPATRLRRHSGQDLGPSEADCRTAWQRDRDRIIYTHAFRRLAGITQTAPTQLGFTLHNRLTHVLEVAQIGRRLAERLTRTDEQKKTATEVGGVDPDVVEAACLAHDLGHPPFGHTTEEVLNDLLGPYGGFEGNAQTFRVVTLLAKRRPNEDGLDLTSATLNAILKYPWVRSGPKDKKYGAYQIDAAKFDAVRLPILSEGRRQTAEANLMDVADDIAYSVHDLEDFYQAGKLPLHRLLREPEDRDAFYEYVAESWKSKPKFAGRVEEGRVVFSRLLDKVIRQFVTGPYKGGVNQQGSLRAMTSALISRFMTAVSLRVPAADEPFVQLQAGIDLEIQMLKELTWCYVIDEDSLATQQEGQRRLINTVFKIYSDAAEQHNLRLIPKYLHEQLNACRGPDARHRLVADLIAGLSEEQVVFLAHRMSGTSLGPGLLFTP